MAKYKPGDILIEDRRGYRSCDPFVIEQDAKYPFCILKVESIMDKIEHNGQILEHRESYWCQNLTRNTYTFSPVIILDQASTIRRAKEMEIYLYGGGREKMETEE